MAGLVTVDSRVKPAYEALHSLIRDEWWTKPMKLVTDEKGSVTVSGFLGEYEAVYKGDVNSFVLEKEYEMIEITF